LEPALRGRGAVSFPERLSAERLVERRQATAAARLPQALLAAW